MKRSKNLSRAKDSLINEKHFGSEPTISTNSSNLDIIRFYNWYNYNNDSEDAKRYVIEYLKSKVKDSSTDPATTKKFKAYLKALPQVDANKLRTTGWGFRNLTRGGTLPEQIETKMWSTLDALCVAAPEQKQEEDVEIAPVISIQSRVESKATDVISALEEELDKFILSGVPDFDASAWMRAKNIKPAIAKKVAEYYRPLYSELYDAYTGKDDDLKEAYKGWKKSALKKYVEFVKGIISTSETFSTVTKVSRKPRKKKEKPATALVEKLKYKEKDDTYNLTSISPATIIGSQQAWVFNVSTRRLSVFNAIGPTGLIVKGTTIIGFDEKTSITKTLRKPKDVLPKVLSGGKLALRKIMEDIKAVEKQASGRINTDTVLIKVVK
jgi:hypothetical protein